MWSNYRQNSLLIAVQSGKDQVCFTKPFLLKMDCKISSWRFLKFWIFYAVCSVKTSARTNISRVCNAQHSLAICNYLVVFTISSM